MDRGSAFPIQLWNGSKLKSSTELGRCGQASALDKYLLIGDLVESQFRADIGAGRA